MKKVRNKAKQYRRMAMAKVRADVRAYIQKGKTNGMDHLGQYPKSMEEAIRTIIALQDLLEESMKKHQKATEHLRDQRHLRNAQVQVASMLMSSVKNIQLKLVNERKQIKAMIKQQQTEIVELKRQNEILQVHATQTEDSLLNAQELHDAHQLVLKHSLNKG